MRLIPLLLVLALATGCDRQKAEAPQANEVAAPAMIEQGVDRSQAGKPAPDTMFKDPDGGETSLAEFAGAPVLVNLWATWCAPCVKELPTLDKLAGARATDGKLAVIAVSQDMGPQPSVRAFLEKLGLDHLGAFHDDKMALSGALGVQVMSTTILFDSEGREIWRYIGDLDWSGPEAAKLVDEAK